MQENVLALYINSLNIEGSGKNRGQVCTLYFKKRTGFWMKK